MLKGRGMKRISQEAPPPRRPTCQAAASLSRPRPQPRGAAVDVGPGSSGLAPPLPPARVLGVLSTPPMAWWKQNSKNLHFSITKW